MSNDHRETGEVSPDSKSGQSDSKSGQYGPALLEKVAKTIQMNTAMVIATTGEEDRLLLYVDRVLNVIPRRMPLVAIQAAVDLSLDEGWIERQIAKAFEVPIILLKEMCRPPTLDRVDRRRLGRIIRDQRRGGHRKTPRAFNR